jgi:hypothetical protein
LRENANPSQLFAAPFRFTIGRRTSSGSEGKLQIGFGIGILMGKAHEAQTERILSNRHPKHSIQKIPLWLNLSLSYRVFLRNDASWKDVEFVPFPLKEFLPATGGRSAVHDFQHHL